MKPKFYVGYAFDKDTSKEKQELYAKQREERGFDDTELWNLDYTLASYILPRLKAFREQEAEVSTPGSFIWDEQGEAKADANTANKNWCNTIDKMITAFQLIIEDDSWDVNKDTSAKVYKGLELFGKYFIDLWN